MTNDFAESIGEDQTAEDSSQVVPGVFLCSDGKLRWTHELSLWRNQAVLLTTWKIFVGAVGVLALFMFLLELERGFSYAGWVFLQFIGIGIIAATVLLLIAYALVALVQGGKYNVLFEMDEKGIRHIQMQKGFKRAQVLAFIGMLAGAAAASPTVVGSNMLAATRAASYSDFKAVKKIIAKRSRNTIYVNETLTHNQVYADPQQFDYVLDYIVRHSTKAEVK